MENGRGRSEVESENRRERKRREYKGLQSGEKQEPVPSKAGRGVNGRCTLRGCPFFQFICSAPFFVFLFARSTCTNCSAAPTHPHALERVLFG